MYKLVIFVPSLRKKQRKRKLHRNRCVSVTSYMNTKKVSVMVIYIPENTLPAMTSLSVSTSFSGNPRSVTCSDCDMNDS